MPSWSSSRRSAISSDRAVYAAAAAVALVERRFQSGISAGELPSDFPVAVRASQVLDLVRGLTMRAQMGMSRKTLLNDAEEAADLVLLAPAR